MTNEKIKIILFLLSVVLICFSMLICYFEECKLINTVFKKKVLDIVKKILDPVIVSNILVASFIPISLRTAIFVYIAITCIFCIKNYIYKNKKEEKTN